MKRIQNDARVNLVPSGDKWPVRLSLTDEQLKLFGPAAELARASVGEVVLALALDRLTSNPITDCPSAELEALLWRSSLKTVVPEIDDAWTDAGFARLGKEATS
jgi:hypothetical protein